MEFNYKQPVEIEFGNGKIKKLKKYIKERNYKKGMLICSKFFIKSGQADDILKDSEGTIINIFSNIEANPTVQNVDECAKLIKANNIEFLVAIGGGSVLDCAKASGSICLTDDSISEYHGTKKKIHLQHLPLILIPTTSGTGSEVTSVSVLTDKITGKKAPIASDGFYANLAIIDPELTYSMPPKLTGQTGIDVLSHAMEAYWSKNHQPICDMLAIRACDLVFKYLLLAYNEPDNVLAREKMSEASLLAGLAFSIPKTTASHACSYPLTNIYNIPHGEACGLTLDYFAKINAKYDNGRLDNFAQNLGFNDMEDMANHISELKDKLGLLNNLKEFNLSDEQIKELVLLSRHPNLYNNPVEITDEMLLNMYNSFK